MMNWLYYLLEANLYLAVFYGFYRLLLHKETYYTLNRYYLVGSTLVAFVLPLLQMGYLNNLFGKEQYESIVTVQLTAVAKETKPFTLNDVLIYCYITTALVFACKTITGIYKIILLSIRAKKQRSGSITYVEISREDTAFSFFNLLFFNPLLPEKGTILKHEMVHISQKHSLDIIFFEIVQIISWFNPVAHFIKKDIKLVHEYIADDLTTNEHIHKHEYAMFLIHNSFGVPNQLTNQIFNQSILKRRINMLNKERSTGRARLKLLFVLPIVGGMLCASTMAFTKDYAMIDLYPEKYESAKSVKQDTSRKKSQVKEVIVTGKPAPSKKGNKVQKVKIKDVPPPPPPVVKQVKFPPPIVTPDNPPVPPPPPPVEPEKEKGNEVTISEIGEKPLLINNGEVVDIPKGKTVTFTAKTLSVTQKNNANAIKTYGNKAKDGVIKMKGTVTFSADVDAKPLPARTNTNKNGN